MLPLCNALQSGLFNDAPLPRDTFNDAPISLYKVGQFEDPDVMTERSVNKHVECYLFLI